MRVCLDTRFEKESNDFENFTDDLTILADKYDQNKNEDFVDGERYTLMIKKGNNQKNIRGFSILIHKEEYHREQI